MLLMHLLVVNHDFINGFNILLSNYVCRKLQQESTGVIQSTQWHFHPVLRFICTFKVCFSSTVLLVYYKLVTIENNAEIMKHRIEDNVRQRSEQGADKEIGKMTGYCCLLTA